MFHWVAREGLRCLTVCKTMAFVCTTLLPEIEFYIVQLSPLILGLWESLGHGCIIPEHQNRFGGPFGMKLWKKLTTRVHPKVQPTSAGINFETHIKEDNQLHQDRWVENFQSCSRGPENIVAHYPPSLSINQVDGLWLYHFNFPGTNFFLANDIFCDHERDLIHPVA